jgi:hypothetical protein
LDLSNELARRQAALEARTSGLERQLADRRATSEAAADGVKELTGALESVRRDVAALGESVRARVAPPAGVPAAQPPDALAVRLARLQEDVTRLDTELAEVRASGAQSVKDLAEARLAQVRTADQVRSLEERVAVAAAAAPSLAAVASPPDFETLFASARQGTREEYQQALEILGAQRLDTVGYASAYYAREAPKDRRAQAGEELTRRGAKTVDRDLILALAHGQPAVRREAAVLLTRNRTRGQDFGYSAVSAAEERQRAVLRAVKWWENEYRDDFPEKAQLQQSVTVVLPVSPVKPAGAAAPAATPVPAPAPPPPQYNPPK